MIVEHIIIIVCPLFQIEREENEGSRELECALDKKKTVATDL